MYRIPQLRGYIFDDYKVSETRYDPKTAESTAKRRNTKAAKKNPLFAASGMLDQVAKIHTGEEIIRERVEYSDGLQHRMASHEHDDLVRLADYLDELGDLMLESNINGLLWYFFDVLGAPKTPNYLISFLHTHIKRVREANGKPYCI